MIAAEAGVDSIEHAYTISEKVLNLMAEKKIFLVPTDAPGVARYQARIQRAVKAGVRFAMPSHPPDEGLRPDQLSSENDG